MTAQRELEGVHVSEVVIQRDHGKVRIAGIPDRPGTMAAIFAQLADVVVDMIVQNGGHDGDADVTITVPRASLEPVGAALRATVVGAAPPQVELDADIAKLSLRGVGIRSHAGVAAAAFSALAAAGVNVEMIATSETEVSVVVRAGEADRGAECLRRAFALPG